MTMHSYFVKQNEENKKKNKRAALKAQMDLEEARKEASQAAERHKDNSVSLQNREGEKMSEHSIKMRKYN